MGWEDRQVGGRTYGPYYTQTRWAGGRPRREYVGGGALGHLAAQLDLEHRRERQARRLHLAGERERWEDLERPLVDLEAATDVLVVAALVAAGFHHEHRRGQWRRRRGQPSERG